MTPRDLDPETIRRGLQTRVFAREIHALEETESTNTQADRLACAGAPEGTLVVADRQTRGRGRQGRPWFSPPGTGLYFSLILRPPVDPSTSHYLVLLIGVASARAIQEIARAPVELKWPNDLQIRGRKIGGILLELNADLQGLRHLVAGIGINVTTRSEDFPRDFPGAAGSLLTETGAFVDRAELLRRLLLHLETRYFRSLERGPAEVLEEWTQLSTTLGKMIRVSCGGETVEGTAVGIDADGGLLVRRASGLTEKVLAGDVTVLD